MYACMYVSMCACMYAYKNVALDLDTGDGDCTGTDSD